MEEIRLENLLEREGNFNRLRSSLRLIELNFEIILDLFLPSKITFKVQNSSGLNISISCSLSVSNLNATDWTLPADFEPGNLVHNIGDILKPTR